MVLGPNYWSTPSIMHQPPMPIFSSIRLEIGVRWTSSSLSTKGNDWSSYSCGVWLIRLDRFKYWIAMPLSIVSGLMPVNPVQSRGIWLMPLNLVVSVYWCLSILWCLYTDASQSCGVCILMPLNLVVSVYWCLSILWCLYTDASQSCGVCILMPLNLVVSVYWCLSILWCLYTDASQSCGVCILMPLNLVVSVYWCLSILWCLYTDASQSCGVCILMPLNLVTGPPA